MSTRDRAAAVLVLVFGQQLQDVVVLTWDDVTVTDELVTVTFGGFAIALDYPLDAPWRELLRNPGHDAMSLRDRLRRHIFSTRAARLGTLHELSKLAPVAIIAEALGYSTRTIETHATASGTDYARYVGAIVGSE